MAPQIVTSDFETVHGCEPRGKREWTFLLGSEPFHFSGGYYAGRRAAVELATTKNIATIRVLPMLDKIAAPGSVQLPAPAAAPITPPPAIVNISTDAGLIRPVVKAPVEIESRLVEDFQMVEIYVDDAILGCGRRRFMVLEIGPRVVRLFSCASLENGLVDRKYFDRASKPAKRAYKKELAPIIRRNIALADRANQRVEKDIMTDGGVWATYALSILEG
jgi:hypothetical protein